MRKFFTFLIFSFLLFQCINSQEGSFNYQVFGDGGQISGISPDGKYATGRKSYGQYSFIWNETDGYRIMNVGSSLPRGISDNGTVVGEFIISYDEESGEPLTGSAYVIDDVVYPLAEAGTVTSISGDGNYIGGALDDENGSRRGAIWELDGTVTVLDDEILGEGTVEALSYDGNLAGGTFLTRFARTQTPFMWSKSEGPEMVIAENNVLSYGLVTAVSSNGRYAGLCANQTAVLYDRQEQKLTELGRLGFMDMLSFITSVSDDGIAVGYSRSSFESNAFIYAENTGMLYLQQYLGEYLGETLPEGTMFENAFISADGRRIFGDGRVFDYDEWVSTEIVFVMDMPEYNVPGRPGNLKARETNPLEILLSWDAPASTGGQVVKGYNIYRNYMQVNDSPVTELTYTDNWEDKDRAYYTVTAVWGDDTESAASDIVTISSALVGMPFQDKFDYWILSESTDWNVYVGDYVTDKFVSWQIDASSGMSFPSVGFFGLPSGGIYDQSLVSPYINTSGYDKVTLTFSLSLQAEDPNGGEDYLDIELYDGEQWSLVRSYTYSPELTAGFHFQAVDLTPWALEKQIRLRFRAHGNNNNGQFDWNIDNFEISEGDIEVAAPLNLDAFRKEDGSIAISWTDPNEAVNLSYLQVELTSFGVGNEGEPVIFANLFDEDDLKNYDGYLVTSISAFLSSDAFYDPDGEPYASTVYRLVAFQGEEKILNRDLDEEEYELDQWSTFVLDEPIVIDASKPFYYGIELVEHDPRSLPLQLSYTFQEDGKSNLYSEDNGKTWGSIYQDFGLNYSYCLKAEVVKELGNIPDNYVYGYYIYRNGEPLLGTGQLTARNGYIDTEVESDQEYCYEVSAYFITREESERSDRVCVEAEDTSVKNNLNNEIYIYPNPASDYIHVSGEFTGVELMDIRGNYLIITTDSKISVESLPAGIYLLKVTTNNGVFTKKIVKQ